MINRAVASLALLKVTGDNSGGQRDYIQNFVPFIATLFNRKSYDRVKPGTILRDFKEQYGLSIPYLPMMAILERARRCGYVTKHNNGSFVTVKDKVQEADFTDIAQEQEREFRYVQNEFIKYCIEKHSEALTEDQAEQIFVAYVKDHDLDLLFINDNLRSLLPPADATLTQMYLMYKFVHDAYTSDPQVFKFILNFSIGHIYANALFYQQDGLDLVQDDMSHCTVYLDSGLLFDLTGINEQDRQAAYEEFIVGLSQKKASLRVFRHTYEEFVNIIEASLQWIGNSQYDAWRASRATAFFVDHNYSYSDVEQFILRIDSSLAQLNVEVVDAPAPQIDEIYQIDEIKLTSQIVELYKERNSNFDEYDKVYTIQRDVKSIAAIHKLRKGACPTKMREVSHVFITSNSALAFASRRFAEGESSSRSFCIPAAVTDVFFGTVIWLNSSTADTPLSGKGLIAACYAALQPSRALVRRLAETADRLLSEGKITAEDVTMLKQLRVSRYILQDETLGDPNRFTDKTAHEILREIRQDLQRQEQSAFDKERESLEIELSRRSNEVGIYSKHAGDAEDRLEQYASRVRHNADLASKWIAYIYYAVSLVFILYISVMQFVPALSGSNSSPNWFWIALAIGLAFANMYLGFNTKDSGNKLRARISQKIVSAFTPNDAKENQ